MKDIPEDRHITYSQQYRSCGRPSCICKRGQKHGPYLYAYWHDQGKLYSAYVGIPFSDQPRQRARHIPASIPLEMREELLTIGEVAKILAVHQSTVSKWIQRGGLAALNFPLTTRGKQRQAHRIQRATLEKILKARRKENRDVTR